MKVCDAGLKRRLEGWRRWSSPTRSTLGEGMVSCCYFGKPDRFLPRSLYGSSMLTLMSVCGLVMLLDILSPRYEWPAFSRRSWTSEKEKKLEQICQRWCFVRTGLVTLCVGWVRSRETSPSSTSSSVVVSHQLAHLGALLCSSWPTSPGPLYAPGQERTLLEEVCW